MNERILKKLRKKRLKILNELSELDQKLGLYDLAKKPDWISFSASEKADPDFMNWRENVTTDSENDSKN